MPDLSFVSLDDLVQEIRKRSDASVVMVEQRRGGQDYRFFDYQGGFAACLGLLRIMEHRLLQHYDAEGSAPAEKDEF